MPAIVSVQDLRKAYAGGLEALKGVSLDIEEGEILALLGPNGAGKTTLISTICGITVPTSGRITVGGHDVVRDFRAARRLIGLVPQEIALEPFSAVKDTVAFSRGIFGLPSKDAVVERVLKQLSLWDKRDARTRTLSGGMKRRVLIAKALAHEPRVLFLDEPTAGVDVELRRDMWEMVRALRETGVTIILTTHYIEEAEEMADRIGVITRGELILVEDKAALMRKLGGKQLTLQLAAPLAAVPPALARYGLVLGKGGDTLMYRYESEREGGGRGEAEGEATAIADLLQELAAAGIAFTDLHTTQRSLEDIFVSLVSERAPEHGTAAAEGAR